MTNEEADRDIEVYQGLRVFGVEVDGSELRADVYGGADSVCGTVLYQLASSEAADEKAATLRRWLDDATPVTYVRRGAEAALLDELAMLAAAFDA